MRLRRSALVAAMAVLALVAPQAPSSAAAPHDIAPPFTGGWSYTYCFKPSLLLLVEYPTTRCQAEASTDTRKGRLGASLQLHSPALGATTFQVDGRADAHLWALHELDRPATSVRYRVTVHLRRARVVKDQLPEIPLLLRNSSGHASLEVIARHNSRGYGTGSAYVVCTWACGQASERSGENIVVDLVMRNDLGLLAAGYVEVSVELRSQGNTGPGFLDLDVDADVRSIVAEPQYD